MKLYHASTVEIDNFYIPYGGLHMGGKHSALEAALRKLRSPLNVVDACTVYLHTLEVDVDNVLLCEDLGSDDECVHLLGIALLKVMMLFSTKMITSQTMFLAL